MVRIRLGRSWKHNPAWLGELRALTPPAARTFTGAALLDGLGIEVDGVDIAADAGEAPIIAAVEELCDALVRIGSGAPAAQATVGAGPTELVLEPRGPDVRITLTTLRRPARVLVGDLLVDAVRLRQAARAAAHGLLLDLLDVCPALEGAPLSRRLLRLCASLSRAPTRAPPAWPPPLPAGRHPAAASARSGQPAVRAEVRLPPEALARLAAHALVPRAPLLPLLSAGTLTLRLPSGPSLSLVAPPYLALRDLLADAHELVRAWEESEGTFSLRFGAAELLLDLASSTARVAGWKEPVPLSAPALAGALGGLARRFAAQALRVGGRTPHPLLAALDESAARLADHCRALASGELLREPASARAPPPRFAPELAPAVRGRVRRIVYREAFHADVGPLVMGGLRLFGRANEPGAGSAVTSGPAGLLAFDLCTGEPSWTLSAGRAPWTLAPPPAGGDLLVWGGEALVRLDPFSGVPRWRRRFPAPIAAVWPLARGTALALADGSAALVTDQGTLALRVTPGTLPSSATLEGGVLLLGLQGGGLWALDAQGSGPLWRRRVGARAGPPLVIGDRAWVLADDPRGLRAALAFDLSTGEPRARAAIPGAPPGDPAPLLALGESVVALGGRGLLAMRAADGSTEAERPLPWGPRGRLLALEPADPADPGGGGDLLALAPSGEVARCSVAQGVRWRREGTPGLLAAAPGVLLHPPLLLETTDGLTLATLPGRVPGHAALLPDLTCAVQAGGLLTVYRAAGHLSLV